MPEKVSMQQCKDWILEMNNSMDEIESHVYNLCLWLSELEENKKKWQEESYDDDELREAIDEIQTKAQNARGDLECAWNLFE